MGHRLFSLTLLLSLLILLPQVWGKEVGPPVFYPRDDVFQVIPEGHALPRSEQPFYLKIDYATGEKQVKWLRPDELDAPSHPDQDIVVLDQGGEEAWSIKENRFTPLVERIRGLLIHLQEEKTAPHEVATWLEDHLYENEIGSSTYTGAFADAGGLDALLYLALSPNEEDASGHVQTVAWRSIGEAIQNNMPTRDNTIYRWTQHADLLGSIRDYLKETFLSSPDAHTNKMEPSLLKATLAVLSSYMASAPVPLSATERAEWQDIVLTPLHAHALVQQSTLLQDRVAQLTQHMTGPLPSPLA